MDAYGCEAPQFMDFQNLDAPEDKATIEAYFERGNSESAPTQPQGTQKAVRSCDYDNESDTEQADNETKFYTPMHGDLQTQNRLSISMVCLSQMNHYEDDRESETSGISDMIKNINLNDNEAHLNEANNQRGCSVKLTPRTNKSAMLRARSNSETRGPDRLAKPKDPQQTKYVSLLEAINQFERRTPVRFHSKPKGTFCSREKLNGPIAPTIPRSPALATKIRHRPVTAVSAMDLEMQELAEIKKFKIKANPLNRKIFAPVKAMQPIKKSTTVIEPFNITEVKKKPATPVETAVVEFRARPMPSAPAKPVEIKRRPPVVPVTPNVLKMHPPRSASLERPGPEEASQEKRAPWKNATTSAQPFSFEQRDKAMKIKKEQWRAQFLEEERKKREFHSRPMPQKIYKEAVHVKLTKKAESMESLKSNKNEEAPKPFKARPPVSLMVEPFVPRKVERPLLESTHFELNVEKRLRERMEFDEKIREKERYLERERQLAEETKRQLELNDLKKKRKETVHTAKPITKFKEMPVVQSRPCTVAVTPTLMCRVKNKENLAQPLNKSYEE